MNKLGKLWTDSVAYVALVAGAGLSIAGNVADTYRTRGAATDALDIWLAVSYPALVVLMVELFVSTRWNGTGWAMQAIRWVGTLAIGGMAMRVSWVHLNELLLSRGQATDVATIGPLAIDSLAIMATALILSGRVATVATDTRLAEAHAAVDTLAAEVANLEGQVASLVQPTYVATEADVAESEAAFRGEIDHGALESWTAADQHWLERLSSDLDSTTTPAVPVSGIPVSPAAASNRTAKSESIPADAQIYLAAWLHSDPSERPTAKDVDALLAGEFGRSTRTTRRWREAVIR